MGAWRRMRHALRFGRKPQLRTQDDDEEDGDKNTGKGSKGSEGSEEDGPREVSDILDLASAEVAELVDAHYDENEEDRASKRPHTLVSEKERLEITDKMFAVVLSIERTKRVIRGLEEGLETAPEEKRLRRSMMRAQVDALEAKAFAKTKNHGIEAYRTLTASKINTLKEAMLALRERQGRLLKDVGQKVDQSHLHAKLGRLEGDNWSRVNFLRRIMLLQARVRGFLARRRMIKLRSAVRTIQSIVRFRKRRKAANRIQALQRRRLKGAACP
ncbi:Myosin-VIIa, partial [Hondaea fermentalgiana]